MDRPTAFSDFTEGDRKVMVQALEYLSGDASLVAQAKSDTLDRFRAAFESAAITAIRDQMQQKIERNVPFVPNPSIGNMMVIAMMAEFYQRARTETLPRAASSPLPAVIDEHAIVYLNAPLSAEGTMLPRGARGTVVAVYQDGAAYEVEFFEPFHCVATVRPEAIVP